MSATQTRFAISQSISTWTKGLEDISAHTYTLTLHLKGNPNPESGWIFPRPQLQELLKNETKQYEGYNQENSPYALLESICNHFRNSKLSPLLEGLSLSWVKGQHIYRAI